MEKIDFGSSNHRITFSRNEGNLKRTNELLTFHSEMKFAPYFSFSLSLFSTLKAIFSLLMDERSFQSSDLFGVYPITSVSRFIGIE